MTFGSGDRRAARPVRRLAIERIAPCRHQPRRSFDPESIASLSESIRQHGLLSPLLVRERMDGQYELVAGERRLRALTRLGQTHADAIVLPAKGREAALLSLVENMQREALHYFDEAEACAALLRDSHITQEHLARELGISQSTLANRLRLLKLGGEVRTLLVESGLSERHARALLRLETDELRLEAAKTAVSKKLTVSALEALVEQMLATPRKKRPKILLRDHRPLVNAVLSVVRQIKQTGIDASAQVSEDESAVTVLVTFPKTKKHP